MKDYFISLTIRLLVGLIIIGIFLGTGYIFDIQWLQEGSPWRSFIILPVALIGGWAGSFAYKTWKRKKEEQK